VISLIRAPQINTNDDQVEIVAWYVASGAYVERGQEIADLETSKATVTVSAEQAGYVEPIVPARTIVKVGAPFYRLAESLEELREVTPDTAGGNTAGAEMPAADTGRRAETLPAARMAREPEAARTPALTDSADEALDGSAELARANHRGTRVSRKAAQLLSELGRSADEFPGAGLLTAAELRRLIGLDRALHERAVRTATPTLGKRAEIQALILGVGGAINSRLAVRFESAAIRARLRAEQLFDGNVQPLILYELSRLLPRWPELTAYYQDGAIHYYDRVDLGVAFDLGKGLKVVTLCGAGQLLPLAIFERTLEIGLRYLENRITPEELVGSTFTVTDLSGQNILDFDPLINGRQSAILGIGADESIGGHPMSLILTFDHRAISGRDVAVFLNELKSRLLSYAAATTSAPHAPQPSQLPSPSTPTSVPAASPAAPAFACDRCGVRLQEYYRSFKDAYVLAWYRPDGTLGRVCHRCFERWS
jgi:pyruvate/2-oxoglutarate dehydrogenase complex dihydrolipoamide acyltransferase (E2) component